VNRNFSEVRFYHTAAKNI